MRTRQQTSPVFQLSGLSREEKKEFGKAIKQLGGINCDNEFFRSNCTHLICGKLSRSEKFLGACATGKWVLRADYIIACKEAKKWLPEVDYEWQPSCENSADPLMCAAVRCRLQFALSGEPAFQGWKVSVLVSDNKRSHVYKRLLTSGGAEVHCIKPSVTNPARVADVLTYIFADCNNAAILMKQSFMEYGILIVKPEFIGDYIIQDPPPDPMDYIVTADDSSLNTTPVQSPNLSPMNFPVPNFASRLQSETPPTDDDFICDSNSSSGSSLRKRRFNEKEVKPVDLINKSSTRSQTRSLVWQERRASEKVCAERVGRRRHTISNTLQVRPLCALRDTTNKTERVTRSLVNVKNESIKKPNCKINGIASNTEKEEGQSSDDQKFSSFSLARKCRESKHKTNERLACLRDECSNSSSEDFGNCVTSKKKKTVDNSESVLQMQVLKNLQVLKSPMSLLGLEDSLTPEVNGCKVQRVKTVMDSLQPRVMLKPIHKVSDNSQEENTATVQLVRISKNRLGSRNSARLKTVTQRLLKVKGFDVNNIQPSGRISRNASPVRELKSESSSQSSQSRLSQPSPKSATARKSSQSLLADFGFSPVAKKRPTTQHVGARNGSNCSQLNSVTLSPTENGTLRCSDSEQTVLAEPMQKVADSSEENPTRKHAHCAVAETDVPSKTQDQLHVLPVKRKQCEMDKEDADINVNASVKRMKIRHPLKSWSPCASYQINNFCDDKNDLVVPTPIPSTIGELVKICAEEKFQLEALAMAQAYLRSCPSSELLHILMDRLLLKAKSVHIAQTCFSSLMMTLNLHPPSTKLIRKVYMDAFCLQAVEEDGVWDFVSFQIREALCQEEPLDQLKYTLLLRFISSVFSINFHSCLPQYGSNSTAVGAGSWRKSILAQCLWHPSYMFFPNSRTWQLLSYLEQCLSSTWDFNQKNSMLEVLINLVSMAAQCCHMADKNAQNLSNKNIGERTSLFITKLASKVAGSIAHDEGTLLTVLRNLHPDWLCLKVCQLLLANMDDYLLVQGLDSAATITLFKIVTQYFFLLPRLAAVNSNGSYSVAEKKVLKSTRSYNYQPASCTDVEEKWSQSNRVNRKNHFGETHLHVACKKNDIIRLQQLLQVPGVDVNAVDNAYWTPLHEACNKGHIGCVQVLLKHVPVKTLDTYFTKENTGKRVDLLAANSEGITPLHDAAINNHLDVCRLLVKYGGPSVLKAQTVGGKYPMDFARTPAMQSLLQTPLTPVKCPVDDLRSSQESQASNGSDVSGGLPSSIWYNQIINQDDSCLKHCQYYITLVTFLLKSYLSATSEHRQKWLKLQRNGRTSRNSNDHSCLNGSRSVGVGQHHTGHSSNTQQKTIAKVIPEIRLQNSGNMDVHASCFEDEFFETKEDVRVLRNIKYHLKTFSSHIKKITSTEDFDLLKPKLAFMAFLIASLSKT